MRLLVYWEMQLLSCHGVWEGADDNQARPGGGLLLCWGGMAVLRPAVQMTCQPVLGVL